jgi:hypothetical protein
LPVYLLYEQSYHFTKSAQGFGLAIRRDMHGHDYFTTMQICHLCLLGSFTIQIIKVVREYMVNGHNIFLSLAI